MAVSQVTLKLSPHELQIIREALRLYRYKMKYRGHNPLTDDPLPEQFHLNLDVIEGQPRNGEKAADKLLRDIGLK